MPFDSFPDRHSGGSSPQALVCAGCKQTIASGESVQQLSFDADDRHRLHEMNGVYHAECALPFLQVGRALQTLKGLSF